VVREEEEEEEAEDGRRMERRREGRERETERALLESLVRRLFKLLTRKRKGWAPSARDGGRTRPFGHSEFNLCSVGSSDLVGLNPRALSKYPLSGWMGKGRRRGGGGGEGGGMRLFRQCLFATRGKVFE